MSDYYAKIQAQMEALKNKTNNNSGTEEQKIRFSPKEGKTVVRILPNFKLGKDIRPFLALQFYDQVGTTWKDPWLAPYQFDEPDAIYDFHQELLQAAYNEKDKERRTDKFKMSNPYRATLKYCVPVLVRSYTPVTPGAKAVTGLESEGVKFWWFYGKTAKELEAIMDDPDYGEIYDLKTGRDITITYTPKDKTSTGFAQIDILAKPNQTPVSEDKEVIEAIKNMPDILSYFTKPTYQQTEEGLQKYLKGNTTKPDTPVTETKKPKAQTNDEFLEEMNATNVPAPKTVQDADDEFDKLLNGE